MKNQNFGDNRDLLKFDLVCEMHKAGLMDHFIYVPMLTSNLEVKEEQPVCRHSAIGGTSNVELVEFLDKCIVNEKRNIAQLEDFFQQCGIKSTIYAKDTVLDHESRDAYFAGLKNSLLPKSLILIDPDKGLEERDNDSGNLLYKELLDIYTGMDEDSTLMVTQKFPEGMRNTYIELRTDEIACNIPGSRPISLDDLDTLVFILSKNSLLQDMFVRMLKEYIQRYAEKKE